MTQTYEHILFSLEAGVARITLNRPDRLNSFTAAMHGELLRAFDQAEADAQTGGGLRGVVITGAGRGFCAGQYLTERKALPEGQQPDLSEGLRKTYRPLMQRLRGLSAPVVCVVNGVAAGAGMSFALACDVVFAVESAKFVQAFSKIGLVPDMGGTWFLPRLVGSARATGLALFGETLTARQAEAWGLIWRCIPDAALPQTLADITRTLAEGPTRAYAAARQALHAASDNTLMEQFDLETDLQREMGRTQDYREGVRAFIEKRPARFLGR